MLKKNNSSDRNTPHPLALPAPVGGGLSSTLPMKINLPEVAGRPPIFTRVIPASSAITTATLPSVPITVELTSNPIFTRAIPAHSQQNSLPPPLDLGANPKFTRLIPSLSNAKTAIPSESTPVLDLGINPTFTRVIPGKPVLPSGLPPPVISDLNPTFTRVLPTPTQLPPNSIFTRVIPASGMQLGDKATFPRRDPGGGKFVAEMRVFRDPGSVGDVSLGERLIFSRTIPERKLPLERSALTSNIVPDYTVLPPVAPPRSPPPMPTAYEFVSPYVADHVISDDATFSGNKIFRPPPYSIYGEMRHLKTRSEGPVSLVGRTSPPLDPRNFALDSLKSTSNFDPPMTFEYTRKHLEYVHQRIMSNSGRYDYLAMTEMLASTRRNQLQMEMRLAHVLSVEQNELRDVRDLLEEQLDELEELELEDLQHSE